MGRHGGPCFPRKHNCTLSPGFAGKAQHGCQETWGLIKVMEHTVWEGLLLLCLLVHHSIKRVRKLCTVHWGCCVWSAGLLQPASDRRNQTWTEWAWSYMISDALFVPLLWAFLYFDNCTFTLPQAEQGLHVIAEVRSGKRWAEGTFSRSPPPSRSECR